jgi:hypothetical protein
MDAQHLPRHLERPRKLEVPGRNMPAGSKGGMTVLMQFFAI